MTAADENATSSLTLQCSLRTSWSLVGNEMNEEPVFLKGTAKLYSGDYVITFIGLYQKEVK